MSHHIVRSISRRTPSVIRRIWCKESLAKSHCLIIRRNNSAHSKILGQSSIFLQDHLDIRELPLVIRRMNAHEFPFCHMMHNGDSVREVTDEDKVFKRHLQDCQTLKDILRLLEVPGDKVTAYSAAFALQRLSQLREGCGDELDSFIKTAVFNELCDTATKRIDSLTTDILITLVKCYLNSKNISPEFVLKVNEEIEKRVGDGVLEVSDMCTLICILSKDQKKDQLLVNSLWIHLGTRFQDITHKNISQVYTTLCNITHDHHYLFKVVDIQLERCWWKLNASEVSNIAKVLKILNHENLPTLRAIGRWISQNGHEFQNISLLQDLMTMYLHFSYTDANFLKALESFIPSNIARLNKTLVSMVMEYCRRRRYSSPKIFNAVALDFAINGEMYEPFEVVFCLRPFGQLNFVPNNASQFFSVVERVLMDRFMDIDAASMVELLTSFSYIGRLPINFKDKVYSPLFMSRLQGSPDASTRSLASRHLQLLRSALLLESPRSVSFVNWHTLGRVGSTITGRWHGFHTEVGHTLVGMLGSQSVRRQFETPRHIAYFIDYEITVDKDGKVCELPLMKHQRDGKTLAVMTMMPEHCCTGADEKMLGEYAMKVRHLGLMGYTVIPVHYEQFMWKARGTKSREALLQTLLEDHISFTTESMCPSLLYVDS